MRGVIRVGDATTGGGQVLAGSSRMKYGGIGAARVGDPVTCPLPGHGLNAIAQGRESFKTDGLPVAFDGHICACGCALISSMPQVVGS